MGPETERLPAPLLDPVLLTTFVTVAERGSFTAAAGGLGYTQSAVSRQVAGLERACGSRLFVRGGRGVRLTPAGEHLLPHARRLIDQLADARRALVALRTLDGGRLRVGALTSATAALVPEALARFHARHPAVALSLREGTTAHLLPLVEGGVLDVAVVSTQVQGDLRPRAGVELVHLVDDPLLVAMPADHPLARAEAGPVALGDLAGERWIVADLPDAVAALAATCAVAGFVPDTSLRVREWTAKLGLVAHGFGVTLVPAMAAARFGTEVALRRIAPDPPGRAVLAALPDAAGRTPAADGFVADLRAAATTSLPGR
ncbi:MAG TPA: LysR family transcriptional regulator [Acidimicrobiales bacterium]|nr:LysR family transcriptional regulator [Acidimicrobiales bacterium]